jgi:NAD(P)-dependent dehydrogenase (short-subunit alcohol dehydrogenase family)
MSGPLMSQRSILITGCSSGIGYHCAHGLKKRGWRVFASCRKPADCGRLAAEELETIRLDYADSDTIASAVDQVLAATGGRLDALFNNGAYAHPGAIEDLATEHLRALVETNFIGWYDLTRRVVPVMRAQGHGRIVNNSSILGLVAVRFSGAYVASKFALEGWTDSLRLELNGTGIRVSLIEPGPIRSRMLDTARGHFVRTIDSAKSPFSRDYANEMARLLSGDRSSRFKLGPEAVLGPLIHALESPNPRARYRVTTPTRYAAWLRRLLPTATLDRVLLRMR